MRSGAGGGAACEDDGLREQSHHRKRVNFNRDYCTVPAAGARDVASEGLGETLAGPVLDLLGNRWKVSTTSSPVSSGAARGLPPALVVLRRRPSQLPDYGGVLPSHHLLVRKVLLSSSSTCVIVCTPTAAACTVHSFV